MSPTEMQGSLPATGRPSRARHAPSCTHACARPLVKKAAYTSARARASAVVSTRGSHLGALSDQDSEFNLDVDGQQDSKANETRGHRRAHR